MAWSFASVLSKRQLRRGIRYACGIPLLDLLNARIPQVQARLGCQWKGNAFLDAHLTQKKADGVANGDSQFGKHCLGGGLLLGINTGAEYSGFSHGTKVPQPCSGFNEMFESGIRAQLLDIKARKLEMDFVIEGDEKSTHILNAVSPGWTCAMPFAAYYCDQIARLSGHIKISFILMGLSGV
jgi:hypothetical protein